jgi:hypothetical protein
MTLWAKPCDFANDVPPRATVSALSPPLTHRLPRPRGDFANQGHGQSRSVRPLTHRIGPYASCGVRGQSAALVRMSPLMLLASRLPRRDLGVRVVG